MPPDPPREHALPEHALHALGVLHALYEYLQYSYFQLLQLFILSTATVTIVEYAFS